VSLWQLCLQAIVCGSPDGVMLRLSVLMLAELGGALVVKFQARGGWAVGSWQVAPISNAPDLRGGVWVGVGCRYHLRAV
jgi:hypothetical protein